nr:endonuclease/exonuclease/phosphatase family protein [Hoylesella enoeca]
MIRQLKRLTVQLVAGANMGTVILMLLVGYSDCINPVTHPFLATIGLLFPIFLALNLGFLVFWLIFKWRYALIPFIGYVICYGPVRTYIPVNVNREAPSDALKVMSFNVWLYAYWTVEEGKPNPVVDYLAAQDADILCLQEAQMGRKDGQEYLDSVMSKHYLYADTVQKNHGDVIALYSKYPIIRHEQIHYESRSNVSAAFHVKLGNDTVIVINNHLESVGLSPEDQMQFKEMMKGQLKGETSKQESRRLIDKLAEAVRKRAPQADAVARYIRTHRGRSIICCGDFNDSPISYAHRVVARELTDCYVATGNGAGISYHHNGFYVRIDNLMCSDDWVPYACKVDDKFGLSDHYPISCRLKKR